MSATSYLCHFFPMYSSSFLKPLVHIFQFICITSIASKKLSLPLAHTCTTIGNPCPVNCKWKLNLIIHACSYLAVVVVITGHSGQYWLVIVVSQCHYTYVLTAFTSQNSYHTLRNTKLLIAHIDIYFYVYLSMKMIAVLLKERAGH